MKEGIITFFEAKRIISWKKLIRSEGRRNHINANSCYLGFLLRQILPLEIKVSTFKDSLKKQLSLTVLPHALVESPQTPITNTNFIKII